MSLSVTTIEIKNFRNYERFSLHPSAELTILVGPNAVGKTNLMEAVQLLTAAESFRKPAWGQLVKREQERASLNLVAEGDGRRLVVEMSVERNGKRAFFVNGKKRGRLSEVAGILPSVIFTPDDLGLVKEAAESRRTALDSLGSKLSPTYDRLRRSYDRIVRQRNAILRDETVPNHLMGPVDEQLVDVGSKLVDARRRLFGRLEPRLEEAHSRVSGGAGIEAKYVRSWERTAPHAEADQPTAVSFRQHLKDRSGDERARKTTLVGPHRDDIVFEIGGQDARYFASQGQQRTIALSWKMAEVAVIEEMTGQTPLLLLDDVMSELDADRRRCLAEMVGTVAQTIITTTNLGYFDSSMISRARVVELS